MGFDIQQQILIAIPVTLKWAITTLWFVWLPMVVFIVIKVYLGIKYKIYTSDELTFFLVSLLKKEPKTPILYVTGDSYPVDFKWQNTNTYLFGKYGKIDFREGFNASRDTAVIMRAGLSS